MNLSLSEAYTKLGLQDGASYDEVLNAKNMLMKEYEGNQEKRMEVEVAYDLIFNSRLKARLSGDLSVSNQVRFADVMPQRRQENPRQILTQNLSLPSNLIEVSTIQSNDFLVVFGVFGALAGWTLVQGSVGQGEQVPGLQIALGVAAAFYLLRDRKRVPFAKAAILSAVGLIAGTFMGTLLESWLRVDLVPLGSLSSPAVVVGEGTILGLFLVLFFLG